MMNDNTNLSNDFNSINLIKFLYKWRITILSVTLLAAVSAVIFSAPWFITPKYKSRVVMFPIATNSVSKALLSENVMAKQDIMEFGDEEQAEQMLQILNSHAIRSRIIEKYNLMDHYKIDPKARYRNTMLHKKYDGNIQYKRTQYMAVEITVMDTDPVLAAEIANEISNIYDSLKIQMQRQRAARGLEIVEAEYHGLMDYIKEMEDSLTVLRNLGVHDYERQTEMINQQLAIELARGNQRGIKVLYEKLDMLAKYGGPYVSIRDQMEHERKQLSLIKSKYDQAKVDATEILPQKFLVEEAFEAEKKSYPVRWLILLVSVVSAFILCVISIVVFENFRTLSKEFKAMATQAPE